MATALRPDHPRTLRDLYASGADSSQGYSTEGDVLVNQTADGVERAT